MSKPAQRIFIILLLLGFALRIGYGSVRYRSVLRLSGDAFVGLWDYDALDHVLIAKALLSGKGYIVDDTPVSHVKRVQYPGQEALFKAPFYEAFLAGCFAVSGFSFTVFFPLQALLGGLCAALVGLTGLLAFERTGAAWLAGLAVAAHPILVNSASQPYNEDLFFFFFAASILSFLVWFRSLQTTWAVVCGIATGLCMLTRGNGLLLLFAMGLTLMFARSAWPSSWMGYILLVITAFAIVTPWAVRNYLRFGVFVPVASIVGEDLNEGNNNCVASEGIFVPYWAEGPCASADAQVREVAGEMTFEPRVPAAVRRDRVARQVALSFITRHPGAYAKLVLRRLWTSLLPFDPRGNQRRVERIVLSLYWLALYPAGIMGIVLSTGRLNPNRCLLLLLAILNLLSIAAVLYWSDLRFRVATDITLACFAGFAYSEMLRRAVSLQSHRRRSSLPLSVH